MIFLSEQVAHAQYISASEKGQGLGALDMLFAQVIDEYSHLRWFDFGISNEQDGRYLNAGLVEYKESFGGRSVVHDQYTLSF